MDQQEQHEQGLTYLPDGRAARPAPDVAAPADRFGLLLLLVVASFVLFGFQEHLWARLLAGLLDLAAIAVVAFVSRTARNPLLGIALIVLGAASVALSTSTTKSDTAYGIGSVLAALSTLGVISMVGVRVLRHASVTIQTLFGATSAYMLLGLFYGFTYGAMDAFGAQPLFGQSVAHSVYSYFSFTTLTTVGFGDYTVKTDVGRRIVAVEAMTGQIFLATALARLVAMYRR